MRFEHIRYARFEKTVLGFIPVNGRKTILILEDYDEMVDPGFYHLVPHDGIKFKNTWALVGAEASHFPEPGIEKSTCLLHGGDTHEDTTGCLITGHSFHFVDSTPDIDGAAQAMELIRELLAKDVPHYINITERFK